MTPKRPFASSASCAARTLSGVVLAAVLAVMAACAGPQPGAGEARSDAEPNSADKRASVRLELASAYFGRGQLSTAMDEVKLALAAKPDMPEAYNLRGLIYAAQGEAALAEQSYQRALQLAPRNGDTLHNHGWFLCQQRRFTEADAQFAAALAVPQYAGVALSTMARGICLARAGRWVDAERVLGRAFELDPSNPAVAFSYSEVLYQRGEYERARFYVRRVNAQVEQSNAQTLWLAARIERRLGNMGGVEDYARQLRDRFPDSPEAQRLMRAQFDD